ncbi:ATP-binding protein [Pyxidicoccus sp. MSG2]|uniref:ATP-binding protein n=1 Tax=Pyxidicoccus sp. MSG2 TaxID=2996790 RepID=UPI00226EB2A1|nr:ATP-binding protein [Pyxidicoccus sp. MSG2]MCY1017649.1 ATP-binding protein [Pyxidicoccus sp. MSG2]
MTEASPALREDRAPLLVVVAPPAEGLDLEAMLAPLGHPIHRMSPTKAVAVGGSAEPPVCVLIDARPGWAAGFERASRLRAVPALKHTPLLLVGQASCEEADLLRGDALGRVDFLMEPLHPAIVRAKVRTFLELRHQDASMRDALERAAHAEGAARESERMLSTLLGNVPGMVYRSRYEHPCPLVYASEGTRALCGYGPEDFLLGNLRWGDLIRPDDYARIWKEMEEALAVHAPFTLTYRIRTRAGEERWMWERGVGLFGPDGTVQLLEGFVTDITVFRRAQDERERLMAAQQSERAKLEAIIQQLPVAVHIAEAPSGRTLHANGEAERLLGHAMLETHCIDDFARYHAVHPDGRRYKGEEYPIARVLLTGEPWGEEDLFYSRPDGALRIFRIKAGPIHDRQGKLQAVVAGFVDITELKRSKEDQTFLAAVSETLASSLEAEATLSRVVRQCVPHLGDGCFLDLVEPEGGLHRLAVAHLDPARELLVRELSRRYPPQLEAPHGPAAAIRTGETWCEPFVDDEVLSRFALDAPQLELLRALGITSMLSVPLRSRDQVLGALTFIHGRPDRHHDAQDQRVAEDLARRAALALDNARLYTEAQAAVRVRDEFLSVASHELRTPLTPLQLTLATLARELWRDGIASHDARARHHLDMARAQVRKLTSLVGALLDVGRLNHGQLTLELAETDLGEVLREVTDWFTPEAAKAGSRLRLEYAEDTHGRWDRLRLEQIVTNLLSNAIRYGGGGDIHARVEDLGDQVRLTVRDEGIGISPKDQERIFGRFERAVSGRHYGGLGLGLFITRNLVEAMGGRIQVESRPKQGSTFIVTLPRAGPRAGSEVPEPTGRPAKVLGAVGAHTDGAGSGPG